MAAGFSIALLALKQDQIGNDSWYAEEQETSFEETTFPFLNPHSDVTSSSFRCILPVRDDSLLASRPSPGLMQSDGG